MDKLLNILIDKKESALVPTKVTNVLNKVNQYYFNILKKI